MLLLKEKRDLLPQIGLLENSRTLGVLERGLTVTSSCITVTSSGITVTSSGT
jgi:hypothetical protein